MIEPRPQYEAWMQRALELARQGLGFVEPNPMVGAVVVDDQGQVVGEGWHERFGGPHAEVNALASAGEAAQGATLFVTLEPCCHFGKTPPCTQALIAAGIRRVVIGSPDPANHGNGSGADKLKDAGIEVDYECRRQADELIAPFTKLTRQGTPWVHAKWAMTLDGKVATHTGSSQWITNESSRATVHRLRGRMDAIITGIGTVLADDPLLTARPAGPRTATRVILDSKCRIPLTSQLVRTAGQIPTIVATTRDAPLEHISRLQQQGIEVLVLSSAVSERPSLHELLHKLGSRQMTNVLIEAGGTLMGDFFDFQLINEVHAFVAPALAGGRGAPSPIAGVGIEKMSSAVGLENAQIQVLDGDLYVHGRIAGW
jgi:diaminohydroxyphosphoribosylaminopyrimidine deaminase / 5-amino-6-(5-phosphoribosylamino)uracil reductase